jgi:hypothetical protein
MCTVNTGVDICQNMSICSRLSTYVKICSYVAFSQHMDTPRYEIKTFSKIIVIFVLNYLSTNL